ncbi:hypothetical protein [Patulibacter minatonensis]|uniref:hypothetical protein n=1 Tax=Patulibacter minatonensis TaxID=298163 RepID=UPI00047D9D06|nr:hypothetical protein [Patulibacter minatonensis]
MTDLAPYEPLRPERGGDGPAELWRRANAPTKATVLGVVLVLVLVGTFFAGRASVGDSAAGTGGAATSTQAAATPEEVAAAKTEDDTAKDAAQTAVTFVESCATSSAQGDYSRCRTAAQLNVGANLSIADGGQPTAGQVAVVGATRDGYRVVAVSRSGNTYSISREGAGDPTRTCTDGGVAGAGCAGGVW